MPFPFKNASQNRLGRSDNPLSGAYASSLPPTDDPKNRLSQPDTRFFLFILSLDLVIVLTSIQLLKISKLKVVCILPVGAGIWLQS